MPVEPEMQIRVQCQQCGQWHWILNQSNNEDYCCAWCNAKLEIKPPPQPINYIKQD